MATTKSDPAPTAETGATTAGEPVWLDDDQQQTWRALASVLQLLPAALDRQLQDEAGVTHTYYMILAMLSEAPQRSLRMSQLARMVSASQSRLTHAVNRLEERGWVERQPSADDKRGQVARLTDDGWDVLTSIAPGHVDEVRRRVFDPLTCEQAMELGTMLRTIADGLTCDP